MNYFSKLFFLSSIFFFNIALPVGLGDILPSKLPNPPQIKVDIDFPVKKAVLPQSICDPSIRKLISSSSAHHNHHVIVEVKLEPKPSWTAENFRDYFAQLFGNNQELVTILKNSDGTISCTFAPEVQKYIFDQSGLYVYPGFRDFIRTLDGFETFIVDFKNSLWHNPDHMNAINVEKYQLPEIRSLCNKSERTFCSHMCEWFTHPCYKSKPDNIGEKTAAQAPKALENVKNTVADQQASPALKEIAPARIAALESTIANNGQCSIKTYEASPEVVKAAIHYGVAPAAVTTSYGSDITNTMHGELVNTAETINQQPKSLLTQEIKQCTYAAMIYNRAGELLKTMALADFCHVALDHTKRFGQFVYGCTEAIPLGCYDGFANFGTFLGSLYENPQEVLGQMAQEVGQLTVCLINVIDAFGSDSTGLDNTWFHPQRDRDMETVAVYTGVLAKAIGEKVAATPTRTLIRQSVTCITEGLLFNECLASVGSACKKTATTAATLSNVMKNAGCAAEVTAEVLQPIAAGVGKIEDLQPSRLQTFLNQIEDKAKKVGGILGKTATFSQEAIEKSIEWALHGNKLNHVYEKTLHGFAPLIAKLGGEEQVTRAIIEILAKSDALPSTGKFLNIPVNVAGYTVVTRGFVHEGIIKIGTMFIPK